ncbi:MAG: hypothetical protein U9R31_03685 [Candidatus Omnitrophota bacterium]|nr:hypothetical protein [Candidatus Omnitrophota bacterium]
MEKKDIIEFSITGVLIFALLFALFNSRRKVKQAGHKGRPLVKVLKENNFSGEAFQKRVPVKKPGLDDKAKELFNELEEETKNLKLKKDPFAPIPIGPKEVSSFSLHLTGIIWDKKNPKAIINGIIVKVGDDLGGNRITDIKQDKVILNNDRRYFELRLGQ